MNKPLSQTEGLIASFLSLKNFKEALKLFYNNFSEKSPPTTEFVKQFFAEMNRCEVHEAAYEFMKVVRPWLPDSKEIEEYFQLAKKIYYDSLIVKGNEILDQAKQQIKHFNESNVAMDQTRKERIALENKKAIETLYEKAYLSYSKALELYPDGLGALTGAHKCVTLLGKTELASSISAKISSISQRLSSSEINYEGILKSGKSIEDESETSHTEDEPPKDIQHDILMDKYRDMFANEKYHELLAQLEKFLIANPGFVPAILLRSQTVAKLGNLVKAEELLSEALKKYPNDPYIKHYQTELLEQKLALLTKAANKFLAQALKLGQTLGKRNFEQARQCLKLALDITPDDLNLLDHLYTCQMYLGEDDNAVATKRCIYRIKPFHKTTYERNSEPALCFLADYAYSDDPSSLETFRCFRREFLVPNAPGRRLLVMYSRISPLVVESARIAAIPPGCAKVLLSPIMILSRICLKCLT